VRAYKLVVTGCERFFPEKDIIVSKTDLKGHITYANQIFMTISDFTLPELLGKPHNVLRHPSMPRSIFKLLWDTLAAERELFAYIVNRCKNGDHYWVLAHVTPSRDATGKVIGYHSNRRVPNRDVLQGTIIPLYDQLLKEENKHADRKAGLQAGTNLLTEIANRENNSYEEFILGL
jgi:PAS domain S-box-containing protein